jgi:hypothetical protein
VGEEERKWRVRSSSREVRRRHGSGRESLGKKLSRREEGAAAAQGRRPGPRRARQSHGGGGGAPRPSPRRRGVPLRGPRSHAAGVGLPCLCTRAGRARAAVRGRAGQPPGGRAPAHWGSCRGLSAPPPGGLCCSGWEEGGRPREGRMSLPGGGGWS